MFPWFTKRRPQPPKELTPCPEQADVDDEILVSVDEFMGDDDDEEPANAVSPDEPIDPARIAARALLLNAVSDPSLLVSIRRPSQLITVEVPTGGWAGAISQAWGEVAFEGESTPFDGDSNIPRWARRNLPPNSWLRFSREAERSDRFGSTENHVSDAVLHGRMIVGFAPIPTKHLPRALVLAADLRVVVPPLDGVVLSAIIATIFGAPCTKTLDDDDCRKIEPDMLRLARRHDQSVDDYLMRLQVLVGEEKVQSGLRFDDLHGMEEATLWGRSLATDLAAYRRGDLAWADVDKGVLLAGPPGTGKTTFSKVLAAECDVALVLASFAKWQASGHLGDMLAAMRRSFDEAKRKAPCIMLIDEIDAVGSREGYQGSNESYHVQVVNAALELLDGADGREGVVVIGACNSPDRIDPAIRRSGRLDRLIRIELPDVVALAKIMRVHLGADDLPDADLTESARMALGSSGADVEKYVRGARRMARNQHRPMVVDDLLAEVLGMGRRRSKQATWIAAVHEAGHAVGSASLRPGSLNWVSIRETDEAGGFTSTRNDGLPTASSIRAKLVTLLCGRAAENLMLGEFSGGAGGGPGSDLGQATILALRSIVTAGLHEEPPVWLGIPMPGDVEGILHRHPDIAARVRQMIADAARAADEFVIGHALEIAAVARTLERFEVISGAEVEAAIEAVQTRIAEGQGNAS